MCRDVLDLTLHGPDVRGHPRLFLDLNAVAVAEFAFGRAEGNMAIDACYGRGGSILCGLCVPGPCFLHILFGDPLVFGDGRVGIALGQFDGQKMQPVPIRFLRHGRWRHFFNGPALGLRDVIQIEPLFECGIEEGSLYISIRLNGFGRANFSVSLF